MKLGRETVNAVDSRRINSSKHAKSRASKKVYLKRLVNNVKTDPTDRNQSIQDSAKTSPSISTPNTTNNNEMPSIFSSVNKQRKPKTASLRLRVLSTSNSDETEMTVHCKLVTKEKVSLPFNKTFSEKKNSISCPLLSTFDASNDYCVPDDDSNHSTHTKINETFDAFRRHSIARGSMRSIMETIAAQSSSLNKKDTEPTKVFR